MEKEVGEKRKKKLIDDVVESSQVALEGDDVYTESTTGSLAGHSNNGQAQYPLSSSNSIIHAAGPQQHSLSTLGRSAQQELASLPLHRTQEQEHPAVSLQPPAEASPGNTTTAEAVVVNSTPAWPASRQSLSSKLADSQAERKNFNSTDKSRAKAPSSLHLHSTNSTSAARSPSSSIFKPINEGPSPSSALPTGTPSTPRTPATPQQQGIPSSYQHPLHASPTVTFTPGSPKGEEASVYFAAPAEHRGPQEDRHHTYIGNSSIIKNYTEPSLLGRAKQALQSLNMVASPRLPFYSGRDDDNHAHDPSSPFTPHVPHHSPQMSRQHSNGNTPSIAFTGPSGLFSATSPSIGRGLFSPSLHTSGFASSSLSPNAASSIGSPGGRSLKEQKRSFYKDKNGSLYPSSGSSYDSGFRKGGVTTAHGNKTSIFRVPRSITRLASRRSRVLPAIIVCTVIFFYALGSTRTSSIYDAAQQASARQVGRFFEAADARVGHLNPMKWAMQNSDVINNKNKQKTFSSSDGSIVEKFDVELLDPAGPLAEPGLVGSAEKRYASWEGGRRDGRMIVQEGKPHPIPKLMARAKQRWHALKNRQSKTFAEAVRQYQRRYGRMPPKGFDRWYAFAKYHDVQLIDEFNLIEEDFRMFRAFTGESIRARVAKLAKETEFAWNIKIENGKAFSDGELKDHDRAKGVLHLIRKFAPELPDLHIVYNGHDTARMNVGWEERMRLDELVQQGQYEDFNATDTEMKPQMPSVAPGWGMSTICPANSAARQEGFDYGFVDKSYTGHEMPEVPSGATGTVIDSFLGYMDVCNSPQYRHFHSSSSYVFPWHPGPTMPLFTAGVQSHFADIHCIITEQFGLESRHDPTWEEKPFDRLVWRGQTSGPLFDKGTAWRSSHRARLHILSHQEDGSRNIAVTDEKDIVKTVEVPNYQLNPLFLDTGFVGPPVQCIKEDGTCDEMREVFNGFDPRISFERASLFKYVLDVDGNSWSGRFPRLMASNAAVVKATIYREFWTDWCIPWLHFIPIQVDYSDLWDVMAFFRGGLGGEGAHDEAAKSIAIAGKNWAREHFRYEDMEAYTFRQYLEYARLWADDREAMTYSGEIEGYEPIWSADDLPMEM